MRGGGYTLWFCVAGGIAIIDAFLVLKMKSVKYDYQTHRSGNIMLTI